jgi:hypothetical protein
MSIVNGPGSGGGSFNYPSTGMGGWLCDTYAPNTCTDPTQCPNNSAGEGEQVYSLFTQQMHPNSYVLTGILQCNGAERVDPGIDPDSNWGGQLGSAKSAVEAHMLANCTGN